MGEVSDMKLCLCSGMMRKGEPGWIRLDADSQYEPDIVAVIPPLPVSLYVLGHGVIEEIELIHGIEHFFPWEAKQLLLDCYVLLAEGGRLVLEQPNIAFAAAVLLGRHRPLTNVEGQSDMWPLYGDPSHRNPLYMHKWGYTPASLVSLLQQTGFKKIGMGEVEHHLPERDFRVEAFK